MVYVNIPYVAENDRLDAAKVRNALAALTISEFSKHEAFEAIYSNRPRGVEFSDLRDAIQLQHVLGKLGVPYRQTNESDYKQDLVP